MPDAGKKTKILVIEDDKFLRELAIQKLEKDGIDVSAAMDGEQGILLAEKVVPDAVLLDILLPGIDGFEVLKRLRANPVFTNTRVVMLSNFGQKEDIEKAEAAGADKFLIKANFTLDEILAVVQEVLATPKK